MTNELLSWLASHWIEMVGALLGIIYVVLSVKQNILTWLLGLLTSLFYIYVFFDTGFYADMSLQFYYVWVSIYGWVLWYKGKSTDHGKEELPVSHIPKRLLLVLTLLAIVLWGGIWFVLKKFTDSPVPVGDSFITALSIVATWMLARKIIEHWLVWIVADSVSFLLYLYKGMYPTVLLYVVYTIAAVWGYVEWKKDLAKKSADE
ncbi:MAG TPA: nicotinamide riboside transporter PnuC [Prolixibacteraceae bacterium]|nr:nicotinamide riboside transporter PnuC [Prolixibacteraceae bacterium]